jgi:hypothetical protein
MKIKMKMKMKTKKWMNLMMTLLYLQTNAATGNNLLFSELRYIGYP